MLVIILFKCIFKFSNWSRLVELQSSDEIKMFYTSHDFQIDLKNFKFNFKFHAERMQHKLLVFYDIVTLTFRLACTHIHPPTNPPTPPSLQSTPPPPPHTHTRLVCLVIIHTRPGSSTNIVFMI